MLPVLLRNIVTYICTCISRKSGWLATNCCF